MTHEYRTKSIRITVVLSGYCLGQDAASLSEGIPLIHSTARLIIRASYVV